MIKLLFFGVKELFVAVNHTFNTFKDIGLHMEKQVNNTSKKMPPKETFEKALERVRSQIEMRNDIMRASLETALRLQEGRGSFVL